MDDYVADPLCGFDPVNTKAMFAGARWLADPAAVSRMHPDLPMYLAVGDQDPVNGNLALFDVLVQRYRDAGIKDLTVRVYPGARHEILNETNRAEIVAEMLAWAEKISLYRPARRSRSVARPDARGSRRRATRWARRRKS